MKLFGPRLDFLFQMFTNDDIQHEAGQFSPIVEIVRRSAGYGRGALQKRLAVGSGGDMRG